MFTRLCLCSPASGDSDGQRKKKDDRGGLHGRGSTYDSIFTYNTERQFRSQYTFCEWPFLPQTNNQQQ